MTSFSDLSLDPRVLQAVTESGYDTPTPIQAQAIPHALEGRDILGIAQTGTGKTASFVLPMITHLSKGRARARMPRSLVLAPTRELAAQVAEQFEKYSAHVKLSMALLIGGVSFKDQDRLIDRGVDVLIATPGRLLDHFERGKLMLTGVQIMVVDEADRMLDMGFIPDIERIFGLVPFTRQTLFFSATMAPEITRITQEFLSNPVRVEVARQATTSETIAQNVCLHKPARKDRADSEKRKLLRALIEAEGEALTNGIIFCNRKRDVDIVAKSLKKYGFDAAALHGDLDQKLRMQILGRFRDRDLKLLIASDVAARGLDIPSVSHVFNYDVPIHSEDYVHRIGRTGRAGRDGKAITLCFPHEEKYLASIEELVEKPIPRMDNPLGAPSAPVNETQPAAAPAAPEKPARKPRRASRSGEDNAAQAARQEPAAETPDRGRGRRGGRGSGPQVVGMGDHVPAFLMRDLRTGETAPDAEAEAETEDDTIETKKPKAKKAASDKPKAKKKKNKDKDAKTAEKPVTDAAADEDAPKAEKPKRARKTARAPQAQEDDPAPSPEAA